MKQVLILFFLLCNIYVAKSQPLFGYVSPADSVKLWSALKDLAAIIEKKDTAAFNEHATYHVTLTNYYTKDSALEYIPVGNKVRNFLFSKLPGSPLADLIQKNKFTLDYSSGKDPSVFRPGVIKLKNWYRIYHVKFNRCSKEKLDPDFGTQTEFDFVYFKGMFYFSKLSITWY